MIIQSIQRTNTDIGKENQVVSSGQNEGVTSFAQVLGEKTNAIQQTTLDDYFQEASQTYGVPVSLLKAVAKAESNFDQSVVSSAGAVGVMQLMPETAKDLGVKNIYDTKENIMGGAKELSQLLERYDGDLTLTLAGYNAGIGNVQKYGGVPPFKETQNYIKKVTAYLGQNIEIPESANAVITSGQNNVSQEDGVSSIGTLLESIGLTSDTESISEKELMQYYIESMKYQIQLSFYNSISLGDEEV